MRRSSSGNDQIEYPIGNVVTKDLCFGMRVSPDGNRIACVGLAGDLRTIDTFDREGKRYRVASGLQMVFFGLAWAPRGDEIIFIDGRDRGRAIRAASLGGRERILVSNALGLNLHDVAPDGRLLVERSVRRGGIKALARGDDREHELGRLDMSRVAGMSEDGHAVLFREFGEGGDAGSSIFLRRTDAAAAINVGKGDAMGLSPDGRWVLALRRGSPNALVMIPTGPGAAKTIPLGDVDPERAWLLPEDLGFAVMTGTGDGKATILLVGPNGITADGGHNVRTLATGGHPISAISPNGDRFAFVEPDGHVKTVGALDREARAIPEARIEQDESVAQWSADDRFLYVVREEAPAQVDRLEIATGKRTPWKRLMPEDAAGIISIAQVRISRDGEAYAYGYLRVLASDLYLIEGVY
jgi:hypothetical protein